MELASAIKKTINYYKKYNYQLSRNELWEKLISNRIFSKKTIKNYFDLYRYDLSLGNKSNFRWQKQKLDLANRYIKRISKNKNILFVGVTGSVAAGNPSKNDDIDLMVVTKRDSLWVSRIQLKVTLLKNKIPHREYGIKDKANRLCFNLWLDESSLGLPHNKQNLRNAVDLLLMKPLVNRNKVYEKLMLANVWAGNYVANGYSEKVNKFIVKSEKKRQNYILFSKIINYLLFKLQYWYMRPKIKKEIVNLRQAFFHPEG